MAGFRYTEADRGPYSSEETQEQLDEQQRALMHSSMLHGGGVEVMSQHQHSSQHQQAVGITTRSGLVLGGWGQQQAAGGHYKAGEALQLEMIHRRSGGGGGGGGGGEGGDSMVMQSPVSHQHTPATVDGGGGWAEVFDEEEFMEEVDPTRNSRDMDLSSSVDSDSKEEVLYRKMLAESQASQAQQAQAQAVQDYQSQARDYQGHHSHHNAGASLGYGGHAQHAAAHAGGLDIIGIPRGHHRVPSPEDQQGAAQFASSPPQDPSFILSDMAAALPDTIPPGSQQQHNTPRSTQRHKFTRVQELRAAEEVVHRAEERIPHAGHLAARANSPSSTFQLQPENYHPSPSWALQPENYDPAGAGSR